jgi:hypothetical protein
MIHYHYQYFWSHWKIMVESLVYPLAWTDPLVAKQRIRSDRNLFGEVA